MEVLNINEILAAHSKSFESFGVTVTLQSNDGDLLAEVLSVARKSLLGKLRFVENVPSDRGVVFAFDRDSNGELRMYQTGKLKNRTIEERRFFKYFDAMLRLAVAENAVDTVFLHAGVVGWNGKAVVIPGSSNTGKSTLVAELIQNGAEYLSDEYAVFDRKGYVHPFPRDLAMRNWEQNLFVTSVSPEHFGASVRTTKAIAGAVLFAKFKAGASWRPKRITIGQGILEALPHALPLHSDTKLSMEVLNRGFRCAIIAKSLRGDAPGAAKQILKFLDKNLN